jgi:hypothetical protein
MTTLRASAVAVLAASCLVACGGELIEAEQTPTPSTEEGVSAQSCRTLYFCDIDNASFTTLGACASYCEGKTYYCSAAWTCT